MRKRVLLSWSSGKDSAWALHTLRSGNDCEVVGLLTTINTAADRVAMHAVRCELLHRQAEAAGLPLWPVEIPSPCSNEEYESAMARVVARAEREGVQCIAFGDLFLRDIRDYREQKLAATTIEPLFPLWGRETRSLAREMIAGGLLARITCIDPRQLSPDFAGREFDLDLLRELPPSVDPCGERGEFHTFAYGGPMFRNQMDIVSGETVTRDGFVFTDLLISPRRARASDAASPSLRCSR